jgi:hypothetical protein
MRLLRIGYTDLGPQTEQAFAVINRSNDLTLQEAADLSCALVTTRANNFLSYGIATDVAFELGREILGDDAWQDVWNAVWHLAGHAVWNACAVVARHELSTYDYDLLTWSWRTVIGPLHPDDPEAALDPAGLIAWQGIAKANPDWKLTEVTQATKMVMGL